MFAIFLDNALRFSIVNTDAKAITSVPLYLSAPGNKLLKGQLRNFVFYPQGSTHTAEYLGFLLNKKNRDINNNCLRKRIL